MIRLSSFLLPLSYLKPFSQNDKVEQGKSLTLEKLDAEKDSICLLEKKIRINANSLKYPKVKDFLSLVRAKIDFNNLTRGLLRHLNGQYIGDAHKKYIVEMFFLLPH